MSANKEQEREEKKLQKVDEVGNLHQKYLDDMKKVAADLRKQLENPEDVARNWGLTNH